MRRDMGRESIVATPIITMRIMIIATMMVILNIRTWMGTGGLAMTQVDMTSTTGSTGHGHMDTGMARTGVSMYGTLQAADRDASGSTAGIGVWRPMMRPTAGIGAGPMIP